MGSRILPIIIGVALSVFPALELKDNTDVGIQSGVIFFWVAEQMQVPVEVPMPPIHFISQADLRRLFETSSQQSFQNWQASYGSGRARQIMNDYLKDVVGMFNPQTGIVYVGSFLSPCRQRAILAHELTHYFQDKTQNDRAMVAFAPEAMKMVREMEAYKIENRFMKSVCADQERSSNP